MAQGRISGRLLRDDLARDTNLTFDTNTLVVDYGNSKVGIGTVSPSDILTVSGNTTLGNIQVSNNQIISVNANAHIVLNPNGVGNVDVSSTYINNLNDPIQAQDAATKAYVDAQVGGSLGNAITLGTATDGNIVDGAYTGWTTGTYVTDAIDDLNEVVQNVYNNTYVKDVDFTADVVAGGEGTTVTLTITATGNPNRYDIDWGTGETPTTATADSTPSHTYNSNANSPYTVTVTAYNNGGSGSGSTASKTRTNYITIYTADPVAGFNLYRNSSGGSALSGSDLYVTEGDTIYLDNDTTNTTSATVAYVVNFGDGVGNISIANDSADGGVLGNRLSYTPGYTVSSGTGTNTVTLTITSHSTANPAVIPNSATKNLKVYDANIAPPNGLSTKTISFSGSVGTSPKLVASATDNTAGTTLTAGDSVSRTVATSGSIETAVISTFAYNANVGNLESYVNNSSDGLIALTTSDNTGTNGSITITAESDYQLLNAGGSAVTFANSIYAPNLFKGFKAKISAAASGIPVGINSYQMKHSITGDTNTIEFVKDNLTATPTISNTGTLSETTAGTKRYISGIPYYNTGSPALRFSGVTISNLTGQTYRDTSTPVQVVSGTNAEGTASASISTQSFTYANIDGSTTMLSGGIPIANVGISSAYAIANLAVNITSSSVRTVEQLGILAYNVNGTGSTAQNATKVQVHTAAQSGISEIAIAVADALGATYDDDGLRITDFLADTTDNPTFNGATNFYTNAPYSESSDPGVSGTQEATVRLGVLKYDVTDYSSGYLPVGPDRSGDTGTQYFTFAFRRTNMANFDINITSSGIAGLWIAAPGTQIDDTSTLNGWLDASATYAGAGIPGADTGNGGNGSNGCAFTSGDRIQASTSLSGGYTMTLGSENASNATGNVVLVRIALTSGQSVTALSVGVAS